MKKALSSMKKASEGLVQVGRSFPPVLSSMRGEGERGGDFRWSVICAGMH
jgi:type II secretory pathway component PulF